MRGVVLRAVLCAILCAIAGLGAAPALADKRIALVIGNSAYHDITRLDNPAHDAALIGATLGAMGFTLVGGGPQIDLDKDKFDHVIQQFGNQLQGADVALFYYAGHGLQMRGSNYLVPIDANPTREADVDFQMVDVGLVLHQMDSARLNVVILDACRNNPFGGRSLRAVGGGLAQMQAPEGTLISYATQPGNVAQDGAAGDSPYTLALAQTIRRGGLDIFQTFNEVGLAVKRATGGEQQPWVSSSPIDGTFYFGGAPAATAIPPEVGVAADPCKFAEQHWKSTETIGTRAAYEDHLARFPNCAFAGLARAKLAQQTESGTQTNAKVASLPPEPAGAAADNEARIGFEVATRLNTVKGWDDYLKKYSNGAYSAQARQARQKLVLAQSTTPTRSSPPAEKPAAPAPSSKRCFTFNGQQVCE